MIKLFRSAVLAGITIGVAGFGYLASGVQGEVYGTLVGAVLFCFGLLTVLGYRLALYTGTAGFIRKNEVGQLALILISNIFGCLIMALFTRLSPMDLQTPAQAVLQGRLNTGALRCGILAIGCGFIMTTTVNFARKGNVLPLLFGVPLFIVCGFPHCMADAFLYMTAPFSFLKANVLSILPMYICIVIGNFVGCNLYRIVLEKSQYSA
jgi:formate/nitrite transporter FocA (FNT family)